MILREAIINAGTEGVRLDKFLAGKFSELSRSQWQKQIKTGFVLVNDLIRRPSYLLKQDDHIVILSGFEVEPVLLPEKIPLDILYQDNDVVVINKPAGMVVHPGAGNHTGTLVNALLYHFQELGESKDNERPGIVHRLDKETSGVMVVARNDRSLWNLSDQFAFRKVKKRYRVLCWGGIEEEVKVNLPIARHPVHRKKFVVSSRGKEAETLFRVVERFTFASELLAYPETGRTHQIRVHLRHLQHPVMGDSLYGYDKRVYRYFPPYQEEIKTVLKLISRQMLHAEQLGFYHPVTGEWIEFTAPLPRDFEQVRARLMEIRTLVY